MPRVIEGIKQVFKKKSVNNMLWLLAIRLLRIVFGLYLFIMLAKYLGPDDFGFYNFCLALLAIFTSISSLGMNSIVVKDIVNSPTSRKELIGTALGMRLISSFICSIFLLSALIIWVDAGDIWLVALLLAVVLVCRIYEVFRYVFEAELRSKYISGIELSVFVMTVFLQVFMMNGSYDTVDFLAVIAIEYVVLTMLIKYLLDSTSFGWIRFFDIDIARKQLSRSLPLLLSAISIMIYMKIDQVMIGVMINDSAVGIYSVATKISEAWNFVPVVICSALFPIYVNFRKVLLKSEYEHKMVELFTALIAISLAGVIVVFSFSNEIVLFLFGSEYSASVNVLEIHLFSSVFVFLGVASGKWLIIEGLQKHMLTRAIIGLIVNVCLNLLLIPRYGIEGAAVSSLLAYSASVLSICFLPGSNKINILFIRSVCYPLYLMKRKYSN